MNNDKVVNTNGRQFTDLCKTADLLILNGRFGTDGIEGRNTCKTYNGSSTIDYICANQNILKHVQEFRIIDFDPALSDVHLPVSMSLSCNTNVSRKLTDSPPLNTTESTSLNWKDGTSHNFSTNFDLQAIAEISTAIRRELDKTTNEITSENINELNTKIQATLLGNATEIGAVKKRKPCKEKKQPWFDGTCARKKKITSRSFGKQNELTMLILETALLGNTGRLSAPKNETTQTSSTTNSIPYGKKTTNVTGILSRNMQILKPHT